MKRLAIAFLLLSGCTTLAPGTAPDVAELDASGRLRLTWFPGTVCTIVPARGTAPGTSWGGESPECPGALWAEVLYPPAAEPSGPRTAALRAPLTLGDGARDATVWVAVGNWSWIEYTTAPN